MELDKNYVKTDILTIPGIREAIRNNDFDEVFKLCGTTRKRMQLARALNASGVNFLNSMTEIPESLFRGYTGMYSIKIPSNIKKIGDFAFMGSGLQAVIIEDGVEEIGRGAFAQTALKEIHLPKSVKEMGELCCGKAKVYCFLTAEEYKNWRDAHTDYWTNKNRISQNDVINEETGEVISEYQKGD